MLRRLVLSRPIATAATMIVCSVGLSLGFWQIDRMQQKLTLAADIAKKEESRPLLANDKDWQLSEVKHHRMIARGWKTDRILREEILRQVFPRVFW